MVLEEEDQVLPGGIKVEDKVGVWKEMWPEGE